MPNPNGRPPQYGERKKRVEISLSPESKAALRADDNPILAAGWPSLSQLAEAILRGEVTTPQRSIKNIGGLQ